MSRSGRAADTVPLLEEAVASRTRTTHARVADPRGGLRPS